MFGHPALVRFVLLGSLMMPGRAFAQFPPPAGSAGDGNSAINGIPYGLANPSVLSDPSGIGNARGFRCSAINAQRRVTPTDRSTRRLARSRRCHPMSERRGDHPARVRTDQEGHLSALADGSD
jgi:hypothetical protein